MIPRLELSFNAQKSNIRSMDDAIVIAIHSFLLNEGFYCIGVGEKWPKGEWYRYTEMLPNEWNICKGVYMLRYKKQGSYSDIKLDIVKHNDNLQVEMKVNQKHVVEMLIPIEECVSDYNEYTTAYKDPDSFAACFKQEVIVKVISEIENLEEDIPIKTPGKNPTKLSVAELSLRIARECAKSEMNAPLRNVEDQTPGRARSHPSHKWRE